MELTTRCPQCETIFQISLEQLQLRKGYIRCVNCAHIFDGFEAVVPAEPPRPPSGSRPPADGPRPPPAGAEPRIPSVPTGPGAAPAVAAPGVPPPAAERRAPPSGAEPRIPSVSAGPGVAPAMAEPGAPHPAAQRREPPSVSGPRIPPSAVETPAAPPDSMPSSGKGPFFIPPPDRHSIDEPQPARPFSIGGGRPAADTTAPEDEPSLPSHRPFIIEPRQTGPRQEEPRLPSVLRQRGDVRGAPFAADPSFTISGARGRAPDDSGPRHTVAPASHGAAASGRPDFFTGDARDDDRPDDDDAADDFLFIEPRAGLRGGKRKPEPFDGARRRLPWMTPVWALLILCGLAGLLAQGVYVYRAQLANAFPALRPVLEEACLRLACSVPYERRIDAIAITGSALRSSAAPQDDVSSLTLEVTLRNTYERAQEWPTLVLDLKDASGTVVVRRNLVPDTWVPAELRGGPFGAGSEITVQVPVAVRGLQANGYQIDKFFP